MLKIKKLNYLPPIILGILAFLVICGPLALNPNYQEWLFGGGDGTGHYLGWIFYKNSPWTFPIGLNPNYGIEINNSIVYSDLIPGAAIFFKIFTQNYSSVFQYFGIWILFSFLMQALGSWKLIGLYTNSKPIKLLCCGLFLFSVPFLNILPDNPALSGQFLVLFALYLNLNHLEKNKDIKWSILLIFGCLVHFYIFAMVFSLWIANLSDRLFIQKVLIWQALIKTLLASISVVLLVAWQAGYFSIDSVGAVGFGDFKSNLFGLINPDGWSLFIEKIYIKNHQWLEEPIYLGLGVLLAFVSASIRTIPNLECIAKSARKRLFFLLILFLLFVFSLSNKVSIGSLEITYWIPEPLNSLFSILRNSGRMFIPVFYAILIFIFYVNIRFYKEKTTQIILILCFALQVTDLSPGWKIVRENMYLNKILPYSASPLTDHFWSQVPRIYESILIIPSDKNLNPDFMGRFLDKSWRIFGRYAAENQLRTNSVYLARFDEKRYLEYRKKLIKASLHGKFDSNSIYIIDDEIAPKVACSILDKTEYIFVKIDGFNVLIPQSNPRAIQPQINPLKSISLPLHNNGVGEGASINQKNQSNPFYTLCYGWSITEEWGTWTEGKESRLYIPLPNDKPSSISLEIKGLLNGNHPLQTFTITTNDGRKLNFSLSDQSISKIQIPIPIKALKDRFLLLNFSLPNAISPKSIGMGSDERSLAIGLIGYTFNK